MPSNTKLLTALLFSLSLLVSGATLTVGPSGNFTKPCQAFAAAASGDTILIDAAGDYRGDVCAITASNLLIRGVNGRPRIDALGGAASGKAIWVVQGNDVIIENVEMLNCKVPDRNGAAVKMEGANLTLRWVYFHHNENGLLTGNMPGDILIEFSEFGYNGTAHNIYVGHMRSLTVRFSYLHHSVIGHEVKSRADFTNLYYNRIMTEQDGNGSLEIDLPNGGNAVVVGNLVQQGPVSSNYAMISFTVEGPYPVNQLRMAYNTFVSEYNPSRIFSLPTTFATEASSSGLVINNIFQGGAVLAPSYASPRITFQNNLQGDGWLADLHNYDYGLLPGSPAIAAAIGAPADLVPNWQYVHPACGMPRTAAGAADQGAYESNAPPRTTSERCALSWHELTPRLTLSSASLVKSGVVEARVTLNGLAPAGGATVSLSSSTPSQAAVPATVTVPAGESTVIVPIDINVGPVGVAIVFTTTLAGRSTTTTLSLSSAALAVESITAGAAGVTASGVVTGKVTLNSPALAGGAIVALASSNPAVLTVPSTATVPAGATVSPNFNMTAAAVSVSTPVTISATYGGITRTAIVTVTPAALVSFYVTPVTISGGKPITLASVGLNEPAPAGGVTVLLTSSNAAALPPASVTVPAGAKSSGYFTIPTAGVATSVPVTIQASWGGVTKSVTITVKPTALYWFNANAAPISSGNLIYANVTLDGPAPSAGAVITLTTANPAVATPPATITVAPGTTVSQNFTMTTGAVAVATPVVITASYGGVSKALTVTVKPPDLYGLSVFATTVSGGKSLYATVSLDGRAPAGGAVVAFSSSNPALAAPPVSVTVAAGATASAYIIIPTGFVTAATTVAITATYGGVSKPVTVNVKPTALLAIAASPLAIKGGLTIGSASVTLDGPAPPGGALVTLSSSNPAVKPASSVIVPAGATVAAFTIPTQAVATATPATVTAACGGVSKPVNLTVNP